MPTESTPSQPIIVTLPTTDADIYTQVSAPVVDLLERTWHLGRCACLNVDLSGVCETYGPKWRDHAPITYTPETVLFALRDLYAAAAGTHAAEAA